MKVKLTSEDWCEPCQQLKVWMKENNISYEEVPMGFTSIIPRVQIGHRVAKGYTGCKNLILEEMKKP